mmetsp:Transcript_27489/g.46125  ORF Transcript_27489/g.46125 Transcript_27489/m.46125 type:complete len:109 (-) Transcript_27489:3167-3493(-)
MIYGTVVLFAIATVQAQFVATTSNLLFLLVPSYYPPCTTNHHSITTTTTTRSLGLLRVLVSARACVEWFVKGGPIDYTIRPPGKKIHHKSILLTAAACICSSEKEQTC